MMPSSLTLSSPQVAVNKKKSRGLRKISSSSSGSGSCKQRIGRRSAYRSFEGGLNEQTSGLQIVSKQMQPTRINKSSILFGKCSFLTSILQLMVMLLILMVTLVDQHVVLAMSKRFLKGFVLGAMFANHHKP